MYYSCVFNSYLTEKTTSFIMKSNQTMLYGETVVLHVRITVNLTCTVWAKCRGLLTLNCRYGEAELVFKI
jgi:hypothetical protein